MKVPHTQILETVKNETDRPWSGRRIVPAPKKMLGGIFGCECSETFPSLQAYEEHYKAAVNQYEALYYKREAYRAHAKLNQAERQVEKMHPVVEAAANLAVVAKKLVPAADLRNTTAVSAVIDALAEYKRPHDPAPRAEMSDPVGEPVNNLTEGEW